MSNKGGRVSPDYLADIAPEYAALTLEVIPVRILGVSILAAISFVAAFFLSQCRGNGGDAIER